MSGQAAWSSSDTSVVRIDEAGVARAVRAGRATLEARFGARVRRLEVIVEPVSIARLEIQIWSAPAPGKLVQCTAWAIGEDGSRRDVTGEVAWRVEDESRAAIGPRDGIGAGRLAAHARGEITVRALLGELTGEVTIKSGRDG